jgi:hypothetical protein
MREVEDRLYVNPISIPEGLNNASYSDLSLHLFLVCNTYEAMPGREGGRKPNGLGSRNAGSLAGKDADLWLKTATLSELYLCPL